MLFVFGLKVVTGYFSRITDARLIFGDRITNHFMQIFDFFHYFLCGQKDTLF